jgi:hypothetical protein
MAKTLGRNKNIIPINKDILKRGFKVLRMSVSVPIG